jgi:hypothetical protein
MNGSPAAVALPWFPSPRHTPHTRTLAASGTLRSDATAGINRHLAREGISYATAEPLSRNTHHDGNPAGVTINFSDTSAVSRTFHCLVARSQNPAELPRIIPRDGSTMAAEIGLQ